MKARLIDLFERDTKARWSIFGVSAFMCSAAGFFSEMNGASSLFARSVALLVGSSVFFGLICLYAQAPKIKVKRSVRVSFAKIYEPIVAIPVSLAIAATIAFTAPGLRASVLNRRLRSVLQNSDVPEKKAQQARAIFVTASQNRVKLRPELVTTALEISENTSDVNSWNAYREAVAYEYYSRNFSTGISAKTPHSPFDLGEHNSYTDVIFSGVQIIYHGGPIKLTRVKFENSTFDVDDTPNGRKFLEAVRNSQDGLISIQLN
jgi:hypothetical protein